MVCHSRAGNFVLGLSESQMNKDHEYGGGCVENQIRVLDRLGMIKGVNWDLAAREASGVTPKVNGPHVNQRPVTADRVAGLPHAFRKFADPYDPKEDLNARARSWLHVNCANCHVESGGGNAQFDVSFFSTPERMRLIDAPPVHQTFGLPDAKLVSSGRPECSILLHRISLRGPGQMPPLATSRVDEPALAMMREWVKSLKK
jgi:hypothetical protein